jgi:hypothetical protein
MDSRTTLRASSLPWILSTCTALSSRVLVLEEPLHLQERVAGQLFDVRDLGKGGVVEVG